MADPIVVPIRDESDIVDARSRGRALGERLGLGGTDLTLIATAISEVARNILSYARNGEIVLDEIRARGRVGLRVVARDRGPGIADVERALEDGFSTGGGLGLGLPGAKRLMDEFDIESSPEGTVIQMTKWAL